ncbi:MAG: cytochrome c biogenesis protein CcsA [Anaerolineae bacterium]|nr:cytochrome c biogenesis protein CcsA [Anaerolineae bacterium]
MTATRRTQLLNGLTLGSVLLFIVANLMAFAYPGQEQTMGQVQRIFYIHLGSFFAATLAFIVTVLGGIAYLRTRNPKWDVLAHSGVEIGLALSTVTTVTGAIWAKPIWGTYWTWDPRLTTIAIMWLTYAAYLFLRQAIDNPDQRRRFASVYGVLAFGSVILTIVIVRVRPDVIHPTVAGPTTSGDALGSFNMTPRIAQTVLFNIFAYCVIAVALLWHRLRLEEEAEALQVRKAEALGRL